MTQNTPISLDSTSGPVELFDAEDRRPVALFFHPGVGLGLVFPALQGCTAELCGLRDRSDELEAAKVRFYGVSTLGQDVVWVDGGNSVNPYELGRICRRFGLDRTEVLDSISVARALPHTSLSP